MSEIVATMAVITIALLLIRAIERNSSRAHRAYVRGDAARTEALLPGERLNTRVALFTALGQPSRAIAALGSAKEWVCGPSQSLSPDLLLVRINLADAYSDLGQADEALRLLDDFPEQSFPLLANGRLCSRAWILANLGRLEEARRDADQVFPEALGLEYEAEGHMAKAKVAMTSGDFSHARAALRSAYAVVERASSERNHLALRGELLRREGYLFEAERVYRLAAEHRWKKQGGAFLLDWANVLEALGRPEEAVAALRQCAEQDPETPAAAEARRRIQAVAVSA